MIIEVKRGHWVDLTQVMVVESNIWDLPIDKTGKVRECRVSVITRYAPQTPYTLVVSGDEWNAFNAAWKKYMEYTELNRNPYGTDKGE